MTAFSELKENGMLPMENSFTRLAAADWFLASNFRHIIYGKIHYFFIINSVTHTHI